MRTSSHLLAAVRKREAMLLESVYSRSFCWNRASYLEDEQEMGRGWGLWRGLTGSSLTAGSQQLPNRPALRLTINMVPASVHLSPVSRPLGYITSLTACLVFFLPGQLIFLSTPVCPPWRTSMASCIPSSVGTSYGQCYLLPPIMRQPQPFRSWYHPPPPNTCILPITWQLSPLIFTNLLPSQPPGLTLTAPPQKCLPCLPLSLQWPPPLSVMLSL